MTPTSCRGHAGEGFEEPCGMVFVRSRGGISHAPAECSSEEDCGLGAQVLARGALALARTVP